VIRACESTAHLPDGERFTWNVEIATLIDDWLAARSPQEHSRLVALVSAGIALAQVLSEATDPQIPVALITLGADFCRPVPDVTALTRRFAGHAAEAGPLLVVLNHLAKPMTAVTTARIHIRRLRHRKSIQVRDLVTGQIVPHQTDLQLMDRANYHQTTTWHLFDLTKTARRRKGSNSSTCVQCRTA